MNALRDELGSQLRSSYSVLRKEWARRIVDEGVPLVSLMGLLHGDAKTAERFTWLIGDVLDADRTAVAPVLPMLFDLRDKMPFPGMRRVVGKCLWILGVPEPLAADAIPVLFRWLEDDQFAVGVKHYASKALYDLAVENRIDVNRLDGILRQQGRHRNEAHAGRMRKLRAKLKKASGKAKKILS